MPELQAGVATTPDETLVDLARGGDLLAREELFRRHWEVAYRVAYRLLGHDQDALDAVQDGLLKAYEHLADFDGRSRFRTWLLRIVTNAALDSGRRRKRFRIFRSSEGPLAERAEVVTHEDPARGLQREDLRRALNAALDRLSGTIKTTFVLFAEAGLSYKEIAEVQGIPDGTVMSRLHYARQKLQSYLEGIDEL